MKCYQVVIATLLGSSLAWLIYGIGSTKAEQPSHFSSTNPTVERGAPDKSRESQHAATPEQAPVLVADYQMRDALNSSVGSAPALTHLGSNAFETVAIDDSPRRVLQFDPNNGVALTPTPGLISNQSYTIVLLFSLSNINGYRRLLDFKNGTSDFGLYNNSGLLQFKRRAFTQGNNQVLQPNAVMQLAITRDSEGNVLVYVNGLRQLFFVDNESDAIINASNTLRFFRDDTGDSESSAGLVARIRLFNTVLSGNDIAGLDRLPNAQVGCPSVSGFNPNNGQPGTTFIISGTGLSGVTSVSFPNGVAASFTSNNATQLTVMVPSGAVTGTLTLSQNSCNPVQTAAVFSSSINTPSALVADYQLQNSLQSSAGYPPALLPLGNNTFETITIDNRFRRALKFEPNNGVALFSTAGLIPSQVYTVAMLVSFSNTSGYRRLLDFKNGTSDFGLYNNSGLLQFKRRDFTQGSNQVIQPNTMMQLTITRDTASNVLVYINGVRQLSFVDSASDALIEGNTLRFFQDNIGDGESSAGFVARIRIFNAALSGGDIAALDRLPTGAVASVSAANFNGATLASESIVAAFGAELATSTQVAATVPLPTSLAGTTVRVKDSTGIERLAPLFFVAPTQVNYQIPTGTIAGTALVTITSGNGVVSVGTVQITAVAPGLFSANASGQGVASGTALRIKADGTQSFEPLARFDAAQNRFVAVPIDFGPDLGEASDQVFLVLYGTGLRGRSALSATAASLGGVNSEVLFAGPAPGFVGLDQTNLRAPRSLRGRGDVNLNLLVDGRAANVLTINFK
jgi:uncharacterized protein (TIGR03437 family)